MNSLGPADRIGSHQISHQNSQVRGQEEEACEESRVVIRIICTVRINQFMKLCDYSIIMSTHAVLQYKMGQWVVSNVVVHAANSNPKLWIYSHIHVVMLDLLEVVY